MWRKLGICLVTLAVFVTTGCFGEQCECEDGVYQAVYRKIDGNCGFTQFYSIPIEYRYSHIGGWDFDEVSQDIYQFTTHLRYGGCEIGLMYQVRNRDVLIFHVEGIVDIKDMKRLSGEVLRVEFDKDTTLEKCRGNYDVELMKIRELVKD
jgi:hypothetical protein